MANFKNNHYVPEMLLKRFMSDKGELFYFDKRRPQNPIQHRNPKSVFCENNLYVDIDRHGNRDVTLERDVYGTLENAAELIVDKIVSAIRMRKTPKLSQTEKEKWDEFFIAQSRRTPEARSSLIAGFDYESEYKSLLTQIENSVGPLNPELKAGLLNPQNIKRSERSAKLQSLKLLLPDVARAFSQKGLIFAIPENAAKCFIVGSYPVARRFAKKDPDLRALSTELWLPISSDIMVSPFGSPGQERVIEIDNVKVRKINEQIYNQSSEVACRSKELLRSLTQITTA